MNDIQKEEDMLIDYIRNLKFLSQGLKHFFLTQATAEYDAKIKAQK